MAGVASAALQQNMRLTRRAGLRHSPFEARTSCRVDLCRQPGTAQQMRLFAVFVRFKYDRVNARGSASSECLVQLGDQPSQMV